MSRETEKRHRWHFLRKRERDETDLSNHHHHQALICEMNERIMDESITMIEILIQTYSTACSTANETRKTFFPRFRVSLAVEHTVLQHDTKNEFQPYSPIMSGWLGSNFMRQTNQWWWISKYEPKKSGNNQGATRGRSTWAENVGVLLFPELVYHITELHLFRTSR